MDMTTKKKNDYLNLLFFIILFLTYLAVTLFLFYNQSIGKFASDMYYYVIVTGKMTRDHPFPSLPYPVLFLTARLLWLFTSPECAMAVAVTFFNGLTAVMLKFFMDIFLEIREKNSLKRGILSTALTFSLLFVSMLYPLTYLGQYRNPGPDFLYRYIGAFSPNPYHNATYLAARPFSIPTFFLFADILLFYETENKWIHPKYLLFAAFLLLTTLTKPSFTLILVSTAGLVMLYRLFRTHCKNIKAFFQLGIYFIPTFFVLLFQYGGMFRSGTEEENGIGIGFLKAWSVASDNIPLSVFLGMAFPLIVALFQIIQKKRAKTGLASQNIFRKQEGLSGLLRFSWQFYLVALFTMLFLYENNERLDHLNFVWGYAYGMFFTYVVSLIMLTQNTLKRRQPRWQLILQWSIYALHLLCGLDYFRILLLGGDYS